MKKLHYLSWVGVLTFIIFIALNSMGMADEGIIKAIADFCCGVSFAMLITAVIYTSFYINKFKAFKKRILQRK